MLFYFYLEVSVCWNFRLKRFDGLAAKSFNFFGCQHVGHGIEFFCFGLRALK